jgi:hypothetical protein
MEKESFSEQSTHYPTDSNTQAGQNMTCPYHTTSSHHRPKHLNSSLTYSHQYDYPINTAHSSLIDHPPQPGVSINDSSYRGWGPSPPLPKPFSLQYIGQHTTSYGSMPGRDPFILCSHSLNILQSLPPFRLIANGPFSYPSASRNYFRTPSYNSNEAPQASLPLPLYGTCDLGFCRECGLELANRSRLLRLRALEEWHSLRACAEQRRSNEILTTKERANRLKVKTVNKIPESALQAGAAIVTERHVQESGPQSSTASEPLILPSAALEAQTRLSLPSTVEEEESRSDKPQPSQRNSSTLLSEIPLKDRTQAPTNEENQPSEAQSTISGDMLPEGVPLAKVTANAQYTPNTLTPVDKDDN